MASFDVHQTWASYNCDLEPDRRLPNAEDWWPLNIGLAEEVDNDVTDLPARLWVGFLPSEFCDGVDGPLRTGHVVASATDGQPPVMVLRRDIPLSAYLPVLEHCPPALSDVLALLDHIPAEPVSRCAYLIESGEDGQTWWQETGEDGGGVVTSPAEPEDLARRALSERLGRLLAEDRDFYDLWYRCTVWTVDWISEDTRPPLPPAGAQRSGYAWRLLKLGITPHAVEVRTPLQVHHEAWRSRQS